ncbi:hypothetical protein D3C87_31900 [compost metagenome]
MKKRAFIYAQVPLGMYRDQLNEFLDQMKKFCAENDLIIRLQRTEITYEWWEHRWEFKSAVNALEYNEIEYFIIVDREQISNHELIFLKAKSEIEKHGTELIILNELS